MISIIYPEYNFRIKEEKNKHFIFDEVRKIWTTLSPEEWVRQNFLQYLIRIKNYPASLISVEKVIKLGELKKRYDIVVYNKAKPWMIVECKEPGVSINTTTIDQVIRYNLVLAIEYFVVTNGNQTFAYKISANNFIELNDLPDLN